MRLGELVFCASMTALAATAGPAQAQQVSPAAPTAAPSLVSPEVMADRRVVFRVFAPKASSVLLGLQHAGTASEPMTRDAAGVWSVTVGPLPPEIYNYNLIIDGVRTSDPANLDMTGTQMSATEFEVPGAPPRFDELQDVPHGSVNVHFYPSRAQHRQRPMAVYVPPQYYAEPGRKFPVLYLWHGANSMESAWVRSGRLAIILDNLIAQKKAVPMIVVCPSNNVLIPVQGGTAGNAELLQAELFDDLMPYLRQHYRVLDDRAHRAIAGLSAGAVTTLYIGMRRLEQFDYIGEFSAGIFGGSNGPAAQENRESGGYSAERLAPGIYRRLLAPATRPRVFWMSVGTEDPRLPYQQRALEDFKQHGIQPLFRTYPGAHEWTVWRHSLADFAPLLFR